MSFAIFIILLSVAGIVAVTTGKNKSDGIQWSIIIPAAAMTASVWGSVWNGV